MNSTANTEAEVMDSPRSLGRRQFFSPTDTNLVKSVSMMSPMPVITSPVSATPDRPTGGQSGSLRRTATCGPGLRQRNRRPPSNIGPLGNAVLYSPMSSDMESLALSPRPPPTIGPLRQQSGSSVLEDHRTPSGLASDLSVLVTPHHHHHLLARTLVGVLFLLPDGFQLPPIHLHMRAPEDSCLTAPVTPPPLDGPLRPGSLNVCSVKIDVRAQHQRRHQHHHGHGSVIGRGGCALLASIIFSFFFPLFFLGGGGHHLSLHLLPATRSIG